MTPKIFIAVGLLLVLIGLALQYAPWLVNWFGRLPGDINIDRDNTRVFIPLTSMIVVSIVLSIILSIFFRR